MSRHPTPEGRDEHGEPDERDLAGKDPMEVLRAALAISPEDAKKARDEAAAKGAKKLPARPCVCQPACPRSGDTQVVCAMCLRTAQRDW